MGKTARFSDSAPTPAGIKSETKFAQSSSKATTRTLTVEVNHAGNTSPENESDSRFQCKQPIYLNEKYGLSYPLLPQDSTKAACPAQNEALLKKLVNCSRLTENIGDNRSTASRALQKLDERLSTGYYRFLKNYETNNVEITRTEDPCCPCETNTPTRTSCTCGQDCPSKNIDRKVEMKRTFHVPSCPVAMPIRQPKSPVDGLKVCPYSPNPCPLGMKCPFPVDSVYDPSAPMPPPPPCPALQPLNRCPLADSSETACPLEPIKPLPHVNRPYPAAIPSACPLSQKPLSCPLSTPPAKTCPLQSQSNCPLLNCSLGPLKNWIFSDGDPCPFCDRPCCPLVTPEGPGCPILKPSTLCPRADEGGDCALASAGPCPPAGPQCPVGLLMERRKRETEGACPCGPQPKYELEMSCPASGALECPALSISKGTSNQIGGKPANCPFSEPVQCTLAPPKCPLGPPEPACPLARQTNCPLQGNGTGGKPGGIANLLNSNEDKIACPVEYPPCDLFPKGRCPQKDLNLCQCEYPVSPCLEPLLCGDEPAREQYCVNKQCCMGLPWPPLKPSADGKFETGIWYKFRDRIPGYELTKHYVDILDSPPEPEFFTGRSVREHDNWLVVEAGKGYMQCEMIKRMIDSRGPMEDACTQFDTKDNPLDPETKLVMDNRQAMEKTIKEMERRGKIAQWKD